MKKLLIVLGLAMAAFSFQASAATINLGMVTNTANIAGNLTGPSFLDTWDFTIPGTSVVGITAVNVSFEISGLIQDFAATLDGTDLFLLPAGLSQFLLGVDFAAASGAHQLVITGSSAGSYTGGIAVAQTPIPAAIWLFGSALMGLTGVSRRKKA